MQFGKELSINGICVVSGMAVGIDKAAHIGAKYGWGKTIAVLGGGFNDIFIKLGLEKRVREQKTKKIVKVDKCYQNVYNVLENIPQTVDKISQKCKCNIANVNQVLTMLELKGFIKAYPGNQYALMEDNEYFEK